MDKKISSVIINKKARHLYDLSDFLEAGIALTGAEVKSIREGKINFLDSYVEFRKQEAWLVSLHIAPYDKAGSTQLSPDRRRRLLLHHREIVKLTNRIEQQGFTIVPTRVYLKRGIIKVEIALARGRKLYDHRNALKQRAEERDMSRELSRFK